MQSRCSTTVLWPLCHWEKTESKDRPNRIRSLHLYFSCCSGKQYGSETGVTNLQVGPEVSQNDTLSQGYRDQYCCSFIPPPTSAIKTDIWGSDNRSPAFYCTWRIQNTNCIWFYWLKCQVPFYKSFKSLAAGFIFLANIVKEIWKQ